MTATIICLIALVIWMGVGAVWLMGLLFESRLRWFDHVIIFPIFLALAIGTGLGWVGKKLFGR